MLYGTAGAVGIGLIVVGGSAAGISLGGGWWGYTQLIRWISNERVAARLRDADGEKIKVQLKHLERSRLVPAGSPGSWELHARYAKGWSSGFTSGDGESIVFTGDEAMEMAGRLMARANRAGGSRKTIQQAVQRIEEIGDPEEFLLEATRESERLRREKAGSDSRKLEKATAGSLAKLPGDIRLAIEMATHEEAERRAMEGELAALEAAWRNAEEIAAIADSLLVPRQVEEYIEEEKRRLSRRPGTRLPGREDASATGNGGQTREQASGGSAEGRESNHDDDRG